MSPRLADSHLHFDLLDPAQQGEAAEGLACALIPGVTPRATRAGLKSEHVPERFVWAAAWHPLYLPEPADEARALEELDELLEHPRVVAVGETGLDYRPASDEAARARQREYFELHVERAAAAGLPISLHCVRAHADAQAIVRGSGVRGVVHAFSGSLQEADAWLELGWMLGFGPTLEGASERRAAGACRSAPNDRILIETDGPFVRGPAGSPPAGSPAQLQRVAQVVATLRGASVEEVAAQSLANFRELFEGG